MFLMLIWQDSIGGSILYNGNVLHGYADGAGDIGHSLVDINGPLCSCGQYGCLERVASGRALVQEAQAKLKSVKNMEVITFAPDTSDSSFEVQNYAVMIGKNADEIIQNINRYDDANHYNKIFAAANTIKVPVEIYILLTINDSSFVVRCVAREITSSPYRGYSNFNSI